MKLLACIPSRVIALLDRTDGRNSIDVSLNQMSSQPIAESQCTLEIYATANAPFGDRRSPERGIDRADREPSVAVCEHGETRTVHGDAFTVRQTVVAAHHAEFATDGRFGDRLHSPDIVDQSGKHATGCSA